MGKRKKKDDLAGIKEYLDNVGPGSDDDSNETVIELIPRNFSSPEEEKKSRFMRDSTIFAIKIKEYEHKYPLEKAVEMAIKYCTDRGLLKEFLERNGSKIVKLMEMDVSKVYAGLSEREAWEKYNKEWDDLDWRWD